MSQSMSALARFARGEPYTQEERCLLEADGLIARDWVRDEMTYILTARGEAQRLTEHCDGSS